MKVGVIGAGAWGANLVRTFHQLGALAAVAEPVPALRAAAAQEAPGVAMHSDGSGGATGANRASRRAVEQLVQSFSQETRMLAAIQAYRAHGVTITRAAEIAGVGYEAMRDRLRAEGILEEGEPPGSRLADLDARSAAVAERLGKRRKAR